MSTNPEQAVGERLPNPGTSVPAPATPTPKVLALRTVEQALDAGLVERLREAVRP